MFLPLLIVQQFDRLVRIVGIFRLVEPHRLLRPFRFGKIAWAILRSTGIEAFEVLEDGHTFRDDCAVTVDKCWSLASGIDECEFRASGFLGLSHDFETIADVWNLLPRERDHDSPTRNGTVDPVQHGERLEPLVAVKV